MIPMVLELRVGGLLQKFGLNTHSRGFLPSRKYRWFSMQGANYMTGTGRRWGIQTLSTPVVSSFITDNA